MVLVVARGDFCVVSVNSSGFLCRFSSSGSPLMVAGQS